MNSDSMVQRVRRLTGIRMDEIATDGDILELVNEAYFELSGEHEWSWLRVSESEAPDGAEVELPWPVQKFTSVVWSDAEGDRRLRQVTFEDAEQWQWEPGRPEGYAVIDAERIQLVPAPEGSGQVRFEGVRQVTKLSGGNDSPDFDPEFHVGLCYAAAARLLAEEGDDSGRVEQYVVEAQGIMRRMQQRYVATHDVPVFQMGSRRRRRRRGQWKVG